MSLRDGQKKMSKSDPSDQSRINLLDSADEIAKKIKRATTDPEPLPSELKGLEGRAEADNLVGIYAALSDKTKAEVLKEYAGVGWGTFKPALADLAVAVLAPIANEMHRLVADPASIDAFMQDGAERAAVIAEATMKDVRKIVLPGSHLMISMYPSKYHWDVPMDGEKVAIRAIKPEDEPLWSEMIESLSPTTAEYRFFGPVREVTKSMLVRYCHIDYDREIALAAIREGKGKKKKAMLGVARLSIETANAEEGEFAILVRDEYQRKGIGSKLMDALIQAARDRHVREINGHVLAANPGMTRFAESLGFDVRPGDEPDVRKLVLRL